MDFLKRARKSVFRQPVKSIVLLLLVFILGTVFLGSISITTAIENTDQAIRRRMPPIVAIDLPQENIPYEETPDGGMILYIDLVEPITSDMIQRIAELPYVNRHYYSVSERLYTYDYDYYFAPFAHIVGSGGAELVLNSGRRVLIQQGNFFQFYGTSDDEPIAMQERVIELVAGESFENIVIATIGVTAAIFTGNVISDMISREMIRTELAQQPSQVTTAVIGSWGQNDTLFHMGFSAELTLEETLEIFEVSLSAELVFIFYIIGLVTILVATAIPVLYIVKLNPKKILMQGRVR